MTSPGDGPAPGQSIQDWLFVELLYGGLSPDEARGVLAMNIVEGGAKSTQSLLGFSELPGGINSVGRSPRAHVEAFLEQWEDMSRRSPGGGIPGVEQGRVTDWNMYMSWLRTGIVGQAGVGNQPAGSEYQRRLMEALPEVPDTHTRFSQSAYDDWGVRRARIDQDTRQYYPTPEVGPRRSEQQQAPEDRHHRDFPQPGAGASSQEWIPGWPQHQHGDLPPQPGRVEQTHFEDGFAQGRVHQQQFRQDLLNVIDNHLTAMLIQHLNRNV